MTFSLSDRLYSMMTGQLFSSMPRESIRPPWVLPVGYSEARKRTPRKRQVLLDQCLKRLLDDDGFALELFVLAAHRHGRA